eukprot:TRINITY_DN240_c0_g4_i1.p1 TRINITY_DN240_c0_g4~~TRINITY_DN240_c0_g4_i1.p1  ORF type:complete len:867 (+),score=232.37 TRINITY_DN240_c0_g4_i1:20-2620(+)
MSQDETLKAKILAKIEKSFEDFLDQSGEDRIVLTKSRSGKISFMIDNLPFSVRYRSSKYPDGVMEFSSDELDLEDWVFNVNDNVVKGMTLQEALNMALEFYGFVNSDVDSNDFGSADSDFGSFDDFDGDFDMDFDDFSEEGDDISVLPDELELIRMKKRWRDKEELLREEKQAEREMVRLKNKQQYKRNEEEKVEQIFTSSAASGVLTNDLLHIMEKSGELGFKAEPVDDNIYHWSVQISKFDNRDMSRQMTELEETFGYNFVELDIEFTLDLYPFYPPLVKVIRPRFQGFMMGRITSLDILKLENWDPIKNMSDIITLIKNMIEENATLDLSHEMNNIVEFPDGAYTKLEHLLLEIDLLSDIDSRAIKKYPMELGEREKGKAIKKTQEETEQNTQKDNQYWAKGTGYGYSGAASESWNVEAYIAAQKEKDAQHEKVIREIKTYLESKLKNLPEEGQILQAVVIEESCLIPTLERYFDNDSLLDISRHETLYMELFATAKAIASNFHTCLLLDSLPQQRKSVLQYLKSLNNSAVLYNNAVTKGGSDLEDNKIVSEIIDTYTFIKERVEEVKSISEITPLYMMGWEEFVDDGEDVDEVVRNNEIYIETMGEMQFDNLDMTGNTGYNHYYSQYINSSSGKEKILRIAQETGSLATSLPLNVSSSVFVRLDEERIDFMSALIIGPEDTPYSGGCFVFDIHFPEGYPNTAPYVWLTTTGGNSFRFNPNLYANGKVCLSLLGTWSGSAGETWNKDTSTLLQVLVSIQSLIMVPDPYFNEPGYERSMGTPSGDKANKDYNANIREGTLRIAMLDQLKHPKYGYEDIIRTHFKLQKKKLIKQVKQWKEESKGTSRYNKMCTLVAQFKEELDKL